MLKSIYQNGGFYVGRYETGILDRKSTGSATQTPVIQANAYPYNYVTVAQAQKLASSLPAGGKQKIYDIAANFWEWTLESTENGNPNVQRGGFANDKGYSWSSVSRYTYGAGGINFTTAFRCSIF